MNTTQPQLRLWPCTQTQKLLRKGFFQVLRFLEICLFVYTVFLKYSLICSAADDTVKNRVSKTGRPAVLLKLLHLINILPCSYFAEEKK